jgi:hypothetical protein
MNKADEDEITITDARDARIIELENLLRDDSKTTARLNELEDLVKSLQKENAKLKKTSVTVENNTVYLDGVSYPILTAVRADNTFSEVKRGNVDEGVTMVVINKAH